jgi:hypothetical protein
MHAYIHTYIHTYRDKPGGGSSRLGMKGKEGKKLIADRDLDQEKKEEVCM